MTGPGGVTVLRATSGRIATKRISVDRHGRISKSPYGNEKYFRAQTAVVGCLHELAALLEPLERDRHAFLIRGEPRDGVDRGRMRRLLHDRPDAPATLAEEPRRWALVDLDGVPNRWGLDPRIPGEAEELVEHIVGLLPEEFHDASCRWQWSSSQCIPARLGEQPPDALRLHLWFWLDRPVPDAELRRWARLRASADLPVDYKLFNASQPHYTAAPIFDGLDDPLPRRSGFREGLVDEVAIVIPDEPPRPSYNGNGAAGAAAGLGGGLGLDGYLDAIGGPGGFHAPIMSAVASWVAHHGPDADAEPLKAELRARIAAADPGPRSAADIDRYCSDPFLDDKVDWVRQRERARPPEPAPRATTLPPYFGEEAADRAAAVDAQRRFIEGWIGRNAAIAGARRLIEARRAAALREAGLDDDGDGLGFDRPPKEVRRRKAAIARRVKREVLAELGLERLPKDGDRDLVTGAQGTGKSRTTAAAIAAQHGSAVAFWWLVPTLEKAEEQAAEYRKLTRPDSPPVTVVRGRGAPDPLRDGEAMCPRHEVVNRAAAMGVKVEREICTTCPLRDACGFQRQRRGMPGHGLFLMAHDYLWLPCPAPRPGVVVVDESAIAKAAETIDFNPARILDDDKWTGAGRRGSIEEAARDLARALAGEEAGMIAEARARRVTAARVHEAVTAHPGRELAFLRAAGVARDDIKACLQHIATKEEARPNVSGRMSDHAIAAALDAVEAREFRHVLLLFRQLRREFDKPRARLNSVRFDAEAPKLVDGVRERLPRVGVGCVRRPTPARATPILVLDGTGDPDLNRKVFGDRMSAHRFAAPRDAEVIQVKGKGFSRQSLTGLDRNGAPVHAGSVAAAARLRDDLRALLATLPGPVLVVTYKRVAELLREEGLPPGVAVAHFGALRGLNAFEDHQTVVVIGREQPSAQAIEAQARPFAAEDDAPFTPAGGYAEQTRRRRMRDGTASIEEVEVHPDPRCQAILEQVREAEIIQAVDRVRPVFNRRRAFLLTPIIADVTVDRVVPWATLRAGGSRADRALATAGDALPLAPAWLAANMPDIFPSIRTAEREAPAILAAARARGGEGINRQTPKEGSIWAVAVYRLARQKRPSQALLRADAPDPRAALEAVVGHVAHFELVAPTPPEAAEDFPGGDGDVIEIPPGATVRDLVRHAVELHFAGRTTDALALLSLVHDFVHDPAGLARDPIDDPGDSAGRPPGASSRDRGNSLRIGPGS